MTTTSSARSADLVLARLHLRIGSLGLARAELEAMAGNGTLDDEALIDLAEVRWRTGDLSGAGDAAGVALESGSEHALAYVIAAEATAAVGRPGEARKLASRALELSGMEIGGLFGGMPRAPIWPAEPSEELAETITLFDSPGEPGPQVGPMPTVAGPAVPASTGVTGAVATHLPGLWDDSPEVAVGLPDPGTALDTGREALAIGNTAAAAIHLALALRLAPTVAPAVLDLIQSVDGPELALVRGDAYRLVGHERDARLAFASAAAAAKAPARTEASAADPEPSDPADKETS